MLFTRFLCHLFALGLQVLRIEGEYDLESMVLYIQTAIDENQIHLNAIRQERYYLNWFTCSVTILEKLPIR